MKKLHIESDIVLQSDRGSIRVLSNHDDLVFHFDDWNTVSAFFATAKGSISDVQRLLRLSNNIDQEIVMKVAGKLVISFREGRLAKWNFGACFKFTLRWLRKQ